MNIACPKCGKPFEPGRAAGNAACPHCGAALPAEALSETMALTPEQARAAAQGAEAAPGGDGAQAGRPTRFANYQILGELGRGAMGVVYKAFDPDLKRTVALKILLAAEHASKEEIERFFREASSAASLQHPNIVPIHELKVHEGKHYYTMDLIEGEPLDALIKARKLSVRRSLELLEKVARALAHAHAKGIVHRDLKPANIIVGADGEPKVTDFGLAKVLTSGEEAVTAAGLTGTGVAMGTPYYESPEQAMGRSREVDARSDVYSLGCIMYELLVGAPPFADGSALEILRKQVEADPVAPSRRGAKVSADVETICLKCLEKDPARRYQSAAELAADLRRFLDGEPVLARRASMLYVTKKKLIRHKVVASVTAVAVTVLIVLTVGYIISLREQIAARVRLEQEKQAKLEADQREADKAAETGRAALKKAEAAGTAAERGSLLIEAQGSFRKALFMVPRNADAEKGMREASLKHFELALDLKNWQQAREKLEQAKQVGLAEAGYKEKDKRLKEAETARERQIRERVEHLMADAQKVKRETLHEMAVSELISLKDPATVTLLLPYVKHQNQWCRMLAIESLAWMGNQGAVPTILPFIWKKCPDGSENPEAVQEVAIRAICILAPEEVETYEAVRKRIWDEAGGLNNLLYRKVKSYYERYGARLAARAEAVINQNEKDSSKLAQAWYGQGLRYKEAGQHEEAVRCYDKALELNPRHVAAYVNRGVAKLDKGDLDGAIRDCDKALELNSQYAAAYLNRGNAKQAKGDHDGAIRDFDKTLELNPREAWAYLSRGNAKQAKGDLDGAIRDFDEALELDPRDALAYRNRGATKLFKGDLDGAIRDCDKALELNPREAGVYNNRGCAKLHKGDLDGAIRDYDKTLELTPREGQAYHNRGNAKQAKGDLDGAIRDYDITLELVPRDALAYMHRAFAGYDCGRFQLARADYGKHVELLGKESPLARYSFLRMLLIELKEGKALADVRTKAKAFRDESKPEGWEGKLFGYFCGEVDEAGLLQAAKSNNPKTEKEQLCEAYFFAGTVRLATGDKAGGRELLEKCLATGASYYTEYVSAKYELERLKK